jgi:hypothetical protein
MEEARRSIQPKDNGEVTISEDEGDDHIGEDRSFYFDDEEDDVSDDYHDYNAEDQRYDDQYDDNDALFSFGSADGEKDDTVETKVCAM